MQCRRLGTTKAHTCADYVRVSSTLLRGLGCDPTPPLLFTAWRASVSDSTAESRRLLLLLASPGPSAMGLLPSRLCPAALIQVIGLLPSGLCPAVRIQTTSHPRPFRHMLKSEVSAKCCSKLQCSTQHANVFWMAHLHEQAMKLVYISTADAPCKSTTHTWDAYRELPAEVHMQRLHVCQGGNKQKVQEVGRVGRVPPRG